MPKKLKRHISSITLTMFILVILLIVCGVNMLVYKALISVFGITKYYSCLILGIKLGVLSLGFISILIIERQSASKLVHYIYFITSIWIGTLVYLFFASVVYDIGSLFGIPRAFGMLLFLIAILISIYGVINGQKIVVKNVSISFPDLPEIWRGRRAIWISDLHLGSQRGKKFAEKVTRISNSLSADIIFVGGDLYDGTHAPDPLALAKPLEHLFAPLGKFFITGNHEEFGDPGPFLIAIRKLGIEILDDKMINIEGVQLAGVDYSNSVKKEQFQEVLKSMNIDKNLPSILLKHEPKDLDVALKIGFSLQISGHTHNGQQWPFNYLADLAYKGYAYGLKNFGKMQVYTSSGVGGWGPPLRVGSNCEIVLITFIKDSSKSSQSSLT